MGDGERRGRAQGPRLLCASGSYAASELAVATSSGWAYNSPMIRECGGSQQDEAGSGAESCSAQWWRLLNSVLSTALHSATLRPAQPCIVAVSLLAASSYPQHIECATVCCPAVRDDEDWENHPNRFKSPVTQQLWSDAIVEIEVRWPSVL